MAVVSPTWTQDHPSPPPHTPPWFSLLNDCRRQVKNPGFVLMIVSDQDLTVLTPLILVSGQHLMHISVLLIKTSIFVRHCSEHTRRVTLLPSDYLSLPVQLPCGDAHIQRSMGEVDVTSCIHCLHSAVQ